MGAGVGLPFVGLLGAVRTCCEATTTIKYKQSVSESVGQSDSQSVGQ